MNTTLLSCTCTSISGAHVFVYAVLPSMLSVLDSDGDCEQGWYDAKDDFVSDGDPRENKTRHLLVINENRENITLSKCIDLYHRVTCHRYGHKPIEHFYQGINDTAFCPEVKTEPSCINSTTSRSKEFKTGPQRDTIVTIAIPIIVIVLIGVLIAVLSVLYRKQSNQNIGPVNLNDCTNGDAVGNGEAHPLNDIIV